MIYDHSAVDGWRTRVDKETKASQQALGKFLDLKKGKTRPKSAVNPLSYQKRNGPWANGGNYADVRFDQPYPDMVERRIQDNVKRFEALGFGQGNVSSSMLRQMQKSSKLEQAPGCKTSLGKPAASRPQSAAPTSRSTQSTKSNASLASFKTYRPDVDSTLLRISPLTEPLAVMRINGGAKCGQVRPEWALMETDPTKIQLRQEEKVYAKGTVDNITMCRLCPLMKEPDADSTPRGVVKPRHYVHDIAKMKEEADRFRDSLRPCSKRNKGSKSRAKSAHPSSRRGRGSASRLDMAMLLGKMVSLEEQLIEARNGRKVVEAELRETKQLIENR